MHRGEVVIKFSDEVVSHPSVLAVVTDKVKARNEVAMENGLVLYN